MMRWYPHPLAVRGDLDCVKKRNYFRQEKKTRSITCDHSIANRPFSLLLTGMTILVNYYYCMFFRRHTPLESVTQLEIFIGRIVNQISTVTCCTFSCFTNYSPLATDRSPSVSTFSANQPLSLNVFDLEDSYGSSLGNRFHFRVLLRIFWPNYAP